MTNLQVLALIAVFLIITFGSFVWYVATWSAPPSAPSSHLSPLQEPA